MLALRRHDLGQAFATGRGFNNTNPGLALGLFERAAVCGHDGAQTAVGFALLHGHGTRSGMPDLERLEGGGQGEAQGDEGERARAHAAQTNIAPFPVTPNVRAVDDRVSSSPIPPPTASGLRR